LRSQTQDAIPELLALFENAASKPVTELSRISTTRKLRQLIQQFVRTEQYFTLKRLAQVTVEAHVPVYKSETLGPSIRRYPYLYGHCLLNEDSSQEQQQIVRQFQAEAQQKFEKDLSHFLTYQTRFAEISRLGSPEMAQRLIKGPENPTLLDATELDYALHQFVGKVEGSDTCRDIARRFLLQTQQNRTYRTFKDELYQYLTATVDPSYGERRFNQRLHKFLKEYNPQSDSQPVSEFLLVRTCTNLLNFLVIESPQNPHHFIFIDLINNIGPTTTTGLLLRVVLLCGKIKPCLEKRFALLFNHYENHTKRGLDWLVQVFENMNLALVTNFGSTNFASIVTK
jgi:hypothetical protein